MSMYNVIKAGDAIFQLLQTFFITGFDMFMNEIQDSEFFVIESKLKIGPIENCSQFLQGNIRFADEV